MNKKGGKKDTLSQLKKEEDKIKKESKKVEEEENSEEEEVDRNQNEVKEQTVEKSDRPKNLKELIGTMGDTKPKPKKKKEKEGKPKQTKYEELGKPKFINTKGTGNYEKKDNEAKNKKNLVYKNAKGLDEAAKENQKIKHTKDYLEKDTEKQYIEYEKVEKPKFTSNIKEGDENFVELNKNEDVRKYFFIFNFFKVLVISKKYG